MGAALEIICPPTEDTEAEHYLGTAPSWCGLCWDASVEPSRAASLERARGGWNVYDYGREMIVAIAQPRRVAEFAASRYIATGDVHRSAAL